MSTRKPRKVDPDTLEALWFAAANRGDDAALELGDPLIDVLVVNGRQIAYSPKAVKA